MLNRGENITTLVFFYARDQRVCGLHSGLAILQRLLHRISLWDEGASRGSSDRPEKRHETLNA